MRDFSREYIQHVNAELRLRGIKVVGKIHHDAETCYVCVSARLHDSIRRELGRQAGETLDRILKDAIDKETR